MSAADQKRSRAKKVLPIDITTPAVVVVPMAMGDGAPEVFPGLRRCPSPSGFMLPLIIQAIRPEVCMQRQREFYHKCHRCQFRGKSADYEAGA